MGALGFDSAGFVAAGGVLGVLPSDEEDFASDDLLSPEDLDSPDVLVFPLPPSDELDEDEAPSPFDAEFLDAL
ncbi:MAG TPA: hypothetical protein VGJ12_09445 [Gemmatimonadaceae bacterium]